MSAYSGSPQDNRRPAHPTNDTYRPSTQAYWRFFLSGLPMLSIIVVIQLNRLARDPSLKRLVVLIVVFAVIVALIAAIGFAYVGLARLRFDGDHAVYRGWFGRRHRFRVSDVAQVVMISGLVTPATGRPPQSYVIALDHHGSRLVRLAGSYWDPQTLSQISRRLTAGGAIIEQTGAIKLSDAAERYPGAILWGEKHPWRVAALILGTTVGFVVLLAVVASAL